MADGYIERQMDALAHRGAQGKAAAAGSAARGGRRFYTRPGSVVRPAVADDAPFVARCVLEALGWQSFARAYDPDVQRAVAELTEVCRLPEVDGADGFAPLYSWRHAHVAMVGGQQAGLVLAYAGAGYHDMRARTFAMLPSMSGVGLDEMADETVAGEYYIDSLCVVPSRRGQGLARRLLAEAIARGRALGLVPTLLVDPANGPALRLYRSLGFEPEGQVMAFGHLYDRMACRP